MSDHASAWEAALFRRLLGQRWLVLLLMVSLQALLVLVLAGLLWATRVKDTFVAQARVEPATGLVAVDIATRDVAKLETGRPVTVIVEPQDGLSQSVCEGLVVAIRESDGATLAAVDIAPGTQPSCAEVGRLLGTAQPTKVTLQARTRRLLLLLLGR